MIAFRGMDSRLRPYADYAVRWANANGIHPQITSVYRGWAQQQRLRSRWEAGLSKWPANRPGDSAHNYGWAFDSWVPADQMVMWAAIRRRVGWDVPDYDIIHAGLPGWRQYRRSAFQRNTG